MMPRISSHWLDQVRNKFISTAGHVSRIRTGESATFSDQASIDVHHRLTEWIYKDVHLQGEETTGVFTTALQHNALEQLSALLPRAFPSPGWKIDSRTAKDCVVSQRDLILRVDINDEAMVERNGDQVTLLLPRVRPNHAYGWHVVFGASGGVRPPLRRIYLPHHMNMLELVVALDRSSSTRKWQLKFSADPVSRRPDRVVLYCQEADVQTLVRAVKATVPERTGARPGPGFSNQISTGIFITPAVDVGTESFGLSVSSNIARAMITTGENWERSIQLANTSQGVSS